MNQKMKILFVGALWSGSTALQRMHAIIGLGHEVVALDYATTAAKRRSLRIDSRIIDKLYRMGVHNFKTPDLAGINKQIVGYIQSNQFDCVFFDKCMTVEIETFKIIKACRPQCCIIGYSPDDMFTRNNQSRQFLENLLFYDIFFTTKSYGVNELQSLGCKSVHFIGNAYDPNTHRPVLISDDERMMLGGQVGFIGSWEADRAQSLFYLAQSGVAVRVWGEGWGRCRQKHDNLRLENTPIWATDYAKGICSFDINLCFLRKINRDLQTTRSIEIPACGGFMLAERTGEHQELFTEGVEAEFFNSDDELLQKVIFYLENPEKRRRIAEAGRVRCINGGYSYADRMNQILGHIDSTKK
jgi:spore maturation protein CgeB